MAFGEREGSRNRRPRGVRREAAHQWMTGGAHGVSGPAGMGGIARGNRVGSVGPRGSVGCFKLIFANRPSNCFFYG
jgi:hypothetical protein